MYSPSEWVEFTHAYCWDCGSSGWEQGILCKGCMTRRKHAMSVAFGGGQPQVLESLKRRTWVLK